jgi:hypothetical protein
MIEYPDGQLALAAEAVEPSGQLIIAEARPAIPTPTLAHIGRGWVPAGAMMRWTEPHYRVRVEGGYLGPSGATFTDEAEARARFARLSGTDEPRTMSRAELMAKLATPRRRGEPYRCARCDRELAPERWVYSHHTGARYCWPGEGCNRKEG